MDISISKTADGRCRKFIGGQWFPLHKDERVAKLQAMALKTQWEQLKDSGVGVWPESVLANKQTFVTNLVSTASVASPAPILIMQPALPAVAVPPVVVPAPIPTAPFNPVPASPYDTLTLYEAMEQYQRHIKSRFECNQIGDDHYDHQLFHIECLKEILLDQPLALVGRDHLTMVKQHFVSRPISGKTGKPLSVDFVVHIMQTTHMLFDWLERSDRWIAPRHWKTYLLLERRERSRLMTPEERKIKRRPKPTFTSDELKLLWKLSSPWGISHFSPSVLLKHGPIEAGYGEVVSTPDVELSVLPKHGPIEARAAAMALAVQDRLPC